MFRSRRKTHSRPFIQWIYRMCFYEKLRFGCQRRGYGSATQFTNDTWQESFLRARIDASEAISPESLTWARAFHPENWVDTFPNNRLIAQKKKRLRADWPKGVSKADLRQPGDHGPLALDPWFCVTAFRRFCPFRLIYLFYELLNITSIIHAK